MSLVEYLQFNNATIQEGYSQQITQQHADLKDLVSNESVKTVLEIGFNAGHSADIFLKNNPNVKLVSFDICEHDSVNIGKKYIDMVYPGRHQLIKGDSTLSIPEYIRMHPGETFDLIFVDGGHDYITATLDLLNCKKLANINTVIAIDDVSNNILAETGWAIGPTNAWKISVHIGIIKELNHHDYEPGRGMSWGKYI
jgi:predicted O-methyltransferase YrrM